MCERFISYVFSSVLVMLVVCGCLGGYSLAIRYAKHVKLSIYALEAMTRNLLITPSPAMGRGNGPETRPGAKPPARGHVAPNLPALGKTLAP